MFSTLCAGILATCLPLQEVTLCLGGNHHGEDIIGVCSPTIIGEVKRLNGILKFFLVLQEW
jgi:hypothetical protein